MNRRVLRCILGAFALWAGFGPAPAQAQDAQPAVSDKPQKIAVIDAEQVLHHMVDLKKGREELAQDSHTAENRYRREKDELRKLLEKLEGLRPDGDVYRSVEQDIATRRADLQALAELQEKYSRRKEAKMIHAALARLEAAVAAWAKENGVTAVLQIDREPTAPWDPDGVSRAVKRQVFYHVDAIDITNLMITQLNDQAKKEEKKPEASLRTQNH